MKINFFYKEAMNVSVRSFPLLLLSLAGFLVAPRGFAQTTVATTPVGYIQETFTPSTSGTSRVFSAVSFPLHQAPVYVGLVASTSSNTITLSGSIPSGLTSAATPFLVHVENAANSAATGQSFLITSASTNSVTVSSPNYTVGSILAAGDQVAIRGAETIGSLFGSTDSTVMLQGGTSPENADVLYLWNGTGWADYYYIPSYGWVEDSDAQYTIQNGAVIYPDEGALVGRISTNTLPATYAMSMGAVPTNAQNEPVSAPGFTFIANPLPVGLTLSQFGFTNSQSWLEGNSPQNSDVVLVWSGSGWQDFYYISNYGWVLDSDPNYNLQTNFVIPAASAVMVHRQTAIAPVNSFIPVNLTYSTN